ncbi:MAG: undecaprenyl-phosphate galactose phosphotransferase WbaP [Phascolarctobacterium sp.]|uniref:undecaprenyl-phosphate galactose phosphotransferase WbaP n=1 Tax=Phascolarctobacterium sp. TaxID=2049039 RepID=UPI0026DD227F|nr:undecaprenyl-phosphate galactose phosphotransferase WbaP [Phascolarctobacterium sp.]MDO4920364.1 undecaprenyl-phosphate galactose phosphotransferase WbaP [Phascolarctobacterium sp.]
MKRYYTSILFLLFIALDYVAILGAEQSAFCLRNWFLHSRNLHISWLNFWIVFPSLFLLFIHLGQLYSRRMPFYKEVEKLFHACCYGTLAVIFVLYVARIAATTSRMFVGLFGILAFILLAVCRYAIKRFLLHKQLLQGPIVIIGAGKTAELLVKGIVGDAGLGYKIVGLLEDNRVQPGILEKYPVLGRFADAERVIKETGVKRVFIAAPGLAERKLGMLIYRIQPLVKNIGVIPNLVGVPTGAVEVESMFNERLVLLRLKNNLARPLNRWLKTIFDYTLTIVGTILISPVLLFIAAWIYKDSPGPVIFKHTRVGKNGKPFPCYKFRSMCVDAKEKLAELLANDPAARAEWEKDFKLKNDPRITKSGAFLRKTSLDELPQIFNVLRGEMSLVGPRPIIAEELVRYGEYVGDYLMVKPGITGMWQVSGRSDTTYNERVQLDSWYVRNWSVWLDVMLLWRTGKSVCKCKGAY